MTRFLITDPDAAAHSAKNVHAAPGLPNQPEQHLKGRTSMVGTTTAPEESGAALAKEQAAGLCALAAMIEQHPELAAPLDHALRLLYAPLVNRDENPRQTLLAFHSAATASGATATVANHADRCQVEAHFGPVRLRMSASADLMADQEPRHPKYMPLAVEPGGGER